MREVIRAYPIGFYVYLLVDPRSGQPFYAGKGQRGRAREHERQVRRGEAEAWKDFVEALTEWGTSHPAKPRPLSDRMSVGE